MYIYKEEQRFYSEVNLLLDMIITASAFYAAYYLRLSLDIYNLPFLPQTAAELNEYNWLILLITPLWVTLFRVCGVYPITRIRPLNTHLYLIGKSIIIGITVLVTFFFLFKVTHVQRTFFIGFGIINFLLLSLKEMIIATHFRHIRKKGMNIKDAILVGSYRNIGVSLDRMATEERLGIRVVGLVIPKEEPEKKLFKGKKVLGHLSDLDIILDKETTDLVIFTDYMDSIKRVETALLVCERRGIEAWLKMDLLAHRLFKAEAEHVGDMSVLVFSAVPRMNWQLLTKRAIDIFGSIFLFVLLSPLFLLAAILIKTSSPGPVIFAQKRAGLRGKKFTLLKFRTMQVDAESKRATLAKLNIMKGPVFKVKKDPRIIRFGNFLRRYSIDELPQLWHVLTGDMSLVGPRPMWVNEAIKLKGWERRRLSMKPGLTCLWQIQGRNTITDFKDWARLDLEYTDNWSLWLDIKILLKTPFVVLSTKGAE